jgi:hypothetical protein
MRDLRGIRDADPAQAKAKTPASKHLPRNLRGSKKAGGRVRDAEESAAPEERC